MLKACDGGVRGLWPPRYCLLVAATLILGCATHKPATLANTFIRQGTPSVDLGGPAPSASAEAFIAQLRKLAVEARPRPKVSSSDAAEALDGALKERLAALRLAPSAERHREVAHEYRRLGVLDAAYSHLSTAIRLDPKDPVSYDQRARVWRAWGLPQLGLRDARKAIALAPRSATAWNTLGLLLEGSGNRGQSIKAYLRSAVLDGDAAYAWTNLCRAWTAEADTHSGLQACRRALALDPAQQSASLNLQRLEQLVAPRGLPGAEVQRLAEADADSPGHRTTLLPSRSLPDVSRRATRRDTVTRR